MQKFSLITFACCLMLAFTACKKETLLETNQDLSPKKNLIANQSSSLLLKEVLDAGFDEQDSASLANVLLKPNKNIALEAATACFGPISGICGSPLIYNSCYYKYQIWNDPNNLYVDLYFPSSVVGWRRDCNGRTCQYYVTPCIFVDLYDANGTKIGSVNLLSSNITVTETRITFNINDLKRQYPALSCVKLKGSFYIMKRCSNCSASRVSTVCITPQQFCLQQCPPQPSNCPTVNIVSLDQTTLCDAGSVNGSVSINGDATKVTTTWTVDGQVYTGNSVSISFPSNSGCEPQLKAISVKSVCTATQGVLKQTTVYVTVNPTVSTNVVFYNDQCEAVIEFGCATVTDVNWTIGAVSGTGTTVPLTSRPETLNYSYTVFGCTFTGTVFESNCVPLIKNNSSNSNK